LEIGVAYELDNYHIFNMLNERMSMIINSLTIPSVLDVISKLQTSFIQLILSTCN